MTMMMQWVARVKATNRVTAPSPFMGARTRQREATERGHGTWWFTERPAYYWTIRGRL